MPLKQGFSTRATVGPYPSRAFFVHTGRAFSHAAVALWLRLSRALTKKSLKMLWEIAIIARQDEMCRIAGRFPTGSGLEQR